MNSTVLNLILGLIFILSILICCLRKKKITIQSAFGYQTRTVTEWWNGVR